MNLAWHFTKPNELRDGRPLPADGVWLEHTEPLKLCEQGLHSSLKPRDALRYAPGSTLCRVEYGGDVLTSNDKLVSSRRKILWRIDATDLLREFARWCALEVIHLWEAPDVVKRYLETGDESLRREARTYADAASNASDASAYDASNASAYASAASASASNAASNAASAYAYAASAREKQNQKLEEMINDVSN